MSSPLVWKIYNDTGEMIATTRHAEDAAAVISAGCGDSVKVDGRVVWREGQEEQLAGDSYDYAATVMHARRQQHNRERVQRQLQGMRSYIERRISL